MPLSPPSEDMPRLINALFGHSEPGDALHHMGLLVTDGSTNALGLAKTTTTVVAIDSTVDPGEDANLFIGKAIVGAVVRENQEGAVLGIVLALEQHHAHSDPGDEVSANRLRRMAADRQLHQHPTAVEETTLYAASVDGRRWHGTHFLTGPDAGKVSGPHLLDGPPRPVENTQRFWKLVRHGVGIPW